MTKLLLTDSDSDKSGAFNNSTVTCPELTRDLLHAMKGVRLCCLEEKMSRLVRPPGLVVSVF